MEEVVFSSGAAEGTTGGTTIDERQQVDDLLSRREMFREEIRGIDVPTGFPQLYGRILHSLLDPETSNVDVPQLTQTRSAADADGCCGVGPHPEVNFPTQAFHESLMSKANS